MTTFDRAFIKAYTEVRPHVGSRASSDASDQAMAAPHTAVERPAASRRLGGRMARSQETTRAAISEPQVTPPPQPLSSFTAGPKIQQSWRAMLEVDRFQWPSTCEGLLKHARPEFERFGEQLIARMGQGQKCLALSSAERGVGRTTLTLVLAKYLAARGLSPVIVDADLSHPGLSTACGVAVSTGWDDLIHSEFVLGESLIAAVDDRITVMPWRTATKARGPLPTSVRVGSAFGTLREHYDLVLIDAMPLVDLPSIAEFANFATAIHLDATYLVHHPLANSTDQLSEMTNKLQLAGMTVGGMIENFVIESKHSKMR